MHTGAAMERTLDIGPLSLPWSLLLLLLAWIIGRQHLA